MPQEQELLRLEHFCLKYFIKVINIKEKSFFFLEHATKKDHLYANDINQDLLKLQNDQFKIYSALSRENPTKKVYVHHLLEEKKEEIEDILEKNNYIVYICGLKGMEDPISIFFKRFFENKYKINFTEEEWNHFAKQLEKQHRLIVETY